MTHQPEQALENNLIQLLTELGYSKVTIKDEADMLANLKTQLEKHNQVSLTQREFRQVLNHLSKGNVFQKAHTLRDKFQLTKEDGESVYLEFMNTEHWCQNIFQVTNQVTMEGSYKNRYDVTVLVNGLPLAQIELKRRGLELKEAFNQVNRYQRHSYWASHGLFQYVQIFVISNGVNTKYYANNRQQTFKQTFFWADKSNKLITQLQEFAKGFLEPCHLSKMIAKCVVLHQADKVLMVLRPYQYYAVEAIVERVKNTTKNGYIWHTTGSGKTLTSFKASQILMKLPQVHKVVFVVDRKDLDYQTTKEFNHFSNGSIDGTDNTKKLVAQLAGDTPLIVTTIQKLNHAVSRTRHLKKIGHLQDKRIIFIFDECHRSQFGLTHKNITGFFQQAQLFGFTGTPIFAENAVKNELGKHTTKGLFEQCLHKYVITDAIKDHNVLKFSVEYVGRYQKKEGREPALDIEVEDIDTKEMLESPQRLEKIADYILQQHPRKTHSRQFTAIFCVSSIDTLIRYYGLFKKKREAGEHNLKVAAIFSYAANEEDKDANGQLPDELSAFQDAPVEYIHSHSREKLDEFIDEYNKLFETKFSTKDSDSFYGYYKDIAKKVRAKQIDILLVVNMFLTGFDSKNLNTLYVDKNLKYHGLIQAYSRTNRLLGELKSQGNIVVFRNLKKATDDAITLFSNKDAKETILIEPYERYVERFEEAVKRLKEIAPEVDSVNELRDEDEQFDFVQAFREVMRLKRTLSTFAECDFEELAMGEQEFEDYKSKYLDLYDWVKNNKNPEKASILEDVDFELELIHRDEINVAYILQLLAQLKDSPVDGRERHRKAIIDMVGGEVQLRSKRLLIEEFIESHLPKVENSEDIPEAFEEYWHNKQQKAFTSMATNEDMSEEKLEGLIHHYLFSEQKPLRDDVINRLNKQPKLIERKPTAERIINGIVGFVDTFISGMPR